MGYADSTGSAAMHTRLSESREQGNVPVRHIVAPGARGDYGPTAPNETKPGFPGSGIAVQ